MPGQAGQNSAVRVSPMDRRGRRISPPVLNAAEEVSRRAILHAERLLVDPAIAANLLEDAAATVPLENLEVSERMGIILLS